MRRRRTGCSTAATAHGRRQLAPAPTPKCASSTRSMRASAPGRASGRGVLAGPHVLERRHPHVADDGDDIAVISFKTKMHTVSDHAQRHPGASASPRKSSGVVIWQPKGPAPPALRSVRRARPAQAGDLFEAMVASFRHPPPAHPVRAGAGGRRARFGAGRRCEVRCTRPERVRAGKLHRPSRGRCRPAAGGGGLRARGARSDAAGQAATYSPSSRPAFRAWPWARFRHLPSKRASSRGRDGGAWCSTPSKRCMAGRRPSRWPRAATRPAGRRVRSPATSASRPSR